MTATTNIFRLDLKLKTGDYFGLQCDNLLTRIEKFKLTLVRQKAGEKGVAGDFYLTPMDALSLARAIKKGLLALQSNEDFRGELFKRMKGGPDKTRRYGVNIISRSLTLNADKGRITFWVNISEGEQKKIKNKHGELVNGIVSPVAGRQLDSFSFSIQKDDALNLAQGLEMEYAAWRSAINYDMIKNPQRYAYSPE